MGEKQLSLQHGETKMAERKNGKLPFPHKLHHMLLESEDLGMSHIISWLPNGKAFKIHNPAAFESTIMKKHFKQTKLKSFTRQLYIYGFTKISSGPNVGGFFHPEFSRNDAYSAMILTRRETKEDRRCKKNRPRILEDLQRSRMIEATENPFSFGEHSQLPHPAGQPLPLLAQIGGNQDDDDVLRKKGFLPVDPPYMEHSIERVAGLVARHLPSPSGGVSKQQVQQWSMAPTCIPAVAVSQQDDTGTDDVVLMEPRSIEEMLSPMHGSKIDFNQIRNSWSLDGIGF